MNLYSFKYFKKYIIEKFGSSDPTIIDIVKKTMSSIESLRGKRKNSEQYSHLDDQTLHSMESNKSDVAFQLLMEKYNKINAVSESNKSNRHSSVIKMVNPPILPENAVGLREIPADPSPKIKIIHRPSIFEGSIDILSSDGKS
jgi:hypothetical protein